MVAVEQLAGLAIDRVDGLAVDRLFHPLVIAVIDKGPRRAAVHRKGLVGAVIDEGDRAGVGDSAAAGGPRRRASLRSARPTCYTAPDLLR